MKRFLLICLSVLPLSIFSQDSLLYIVNPGQNQVEIYNLTQDLFEPPLTYAGFNLGFGNVAFNNDLTKIYITNYDGDFVSVFDAATLTHLGDFGSNPDLQNPEELAFSADGTKLYISNYDAADSQSVAVYNIDPITGLGVLSNHFGGSPSNPTGFTASLALNRARDRLYLVSGALENKVSVFDLSTEILIGEFTDLNMDNPLGCFYNNTENALYLCNYNNNTISVYAIDPTTGLGTFS